MRKVFILLYAELAELFRKFIMLSDTSIKLIFVPGFNRLRNFNAHARAYAEFIKAKKNVPAYKAFLRSSGFSQPSFKGIFPQMHEVPSTDKENYVNRFTMDERCVNGRIPSRGVIIDESSGSSGTAVNWARGKAERKRNARFIQFGMKNLLGKEPLFIINAFALGPWATGVNITMSCVAFSKLKSLGPDKIKIQNTLQHFGKEPKYIIMGYPPFLKLLVDDLAINWKEYNVSFIFGGEAMSEGMRDYLTQKGIRKIYSSLGASDVELNMAAENDFTISLRKLLRSNAQLQKRVVKYSGALPMVFQYNPADFLFECSDSGELIITVCRPAYISPKIRYNLHDKGQVVQIKDLYKILKELNIDREQLALSKTDLPILLHYGRADMTVSFFGANITPNDIHEVLYKFPEVVTIINSFAIQIKEDNEGSKQLIISLEMQEGRSKGLLDLTLLQTDFFKYLSEINQDFKEARRMLSHNEQTQITLFNASEGPFAANDIRVKAKYIQ